MFLRIFFYPKKYDRFEPITTGLNVEYYTACRGTIYPRDNIHDRVFYCQTRGCNPEHRFNSIQDFLRWYFLKIYFSQFVKKIHKTEENLRNMFPLPCLPPPLKIFKSHHSKNHLLTWHLKQDG